MATPVAYVCHKHGSFALWYVPTRLCRQSVWVRRKRWATDEEVAAADVVFGDRQRHRPILVRQLLSRASAVAPDPPGDRSAGAAAGDTGPTTEPPENGEKTTAGQEAPPRSKKRRSRRAKS